MLNPAEDKYKPCYTPNIDTISSDWTQYITSVKAIETATGYTLLSNVPAAIRTVLENKVDAGN